MVAAVAAVVPMVEEAAMAAAVAGPGATAVGDMAEVAEAMALQLVLLPMFLLDLAAQPRPMTLTATLHATAVAHGQSLRQSDGTHGSCNCGLETLASVF